MKFDSSSRKSNQTESDGQKYFIAFETLKEKMIEDAKKRAQKINKTPEEVEKKIREDMKKEELEFPRLSHLYLLISNKTIEFLVNYKEDQDKLEKGYSNLLYLIAETQKYEPNILEYGLSNTESQSWEDQNLETQTQHLFKNQEKLNRAMEHYVRQIEFLRTRRFEKKTIQISYISATIAAISAVLSILFFFLGIYFNLIVRT